MRARFLACKYACALLMFSLLTACSNVSDVPASEVETQLHTELDSIEKVSVLSTDGQEVVIDVAEFIKDVSHESKSFIKPSLPPLDREDIRYTLIVNRKKGAPFVLEVGSNQPEMERLYHWMRKITGNALFKQPNIRTQEMKMKDLHASLLPGEDDTAFITKKLQEATFEDVAQPHQYPLYPAYQLTIDMGNRDLEATLLTPSLMAVAFGKEELYYRIDTQLFSRLASLLPLQNPDPNQLDMLFRATQFRVSAEKQGKMQEQRYEIAESSVLKGTAQQVVRLLKESTPIHLENEGKKSELILHYTVDDQEIDIPCVDDTFIWQGLSFQHPGLTASIKALLNESQK